MYFDLDIVYLDKENNVIKVIRSLKPFRIALPVGNTVSILEIPSHTADIEALSPGVKIIDL
jgi:uncharacterized membrane protein (UPF0127 family)